MKRYQRVLAFALAVGWLGACTGTPARDSEPENYLRSIGFPMPGNEAVLLRWQHRQMPLQVFLPEPPPGLFADPQETLEVVRESILKWEDLAAPGIPSFEFVDEQGQADIPVAWAEEPDGDWYIAHCAFQINSMTRTFGVARVLITGRWRSGQVAPPKQIGSTVTHEFGHALGLLHSPSPVDIMYPYLEPGITEPSFRDEATLRMLYESPIGRRVGRARRGR